MHGHSLDTSFPSPPLHPHVLPALPDATPLSAEQPAGSGASLCLSSNPSYSYGGEVILGGTDPQLYSGEILWASVVQEYYWKIGIEE